MKHSAVILSGASVKTLIVVGSVFCAAVCAGCPAPEGEGEGEGEGEDEEAHCVQTIGSGATCSTAVSLTDWERVGFARGFVDNRNPTAVFFAAGGAGVYRSTDCGTGPAVLAGSPVNAVLAPGADVGTLFAMSDHVYLGTSSGDAWADLTPTILGFVPAAGVRLGDTIVVVPESVNNLDTLSGISDDGGTTWAPLAVSGVAVVPSDGGLVFLSSAGAITRIEGTQTYQTQLNLSALNARPPHSLAASADTLTVYAAGAGDNEMRLFRSDDGGKLWAPQDCPSSGGLSNVCFAVSSPQELTLGGVDPASPSTVYLLIDGVVNVSTDGGSTFAPTDGVGAFMAVHKTRAGVLAAVGGTTLMRSEDGGSTWSSETIGGSVLYLYPGVVFAGDHVVIQTDDAGVFVDDINVGADLRVVFVSGEDVFVRSADSSIGFGVLLGGAPPVVQLDNGLNGPFVDGIADERALLVRNASGTVSRSFDAGVTWARVDALSGGTGLLRSATGVIALGPTGTVLFSGDDGDTVATGPSAGLVAVDEISPLVFVKTPDNAYAASYDGGKTFVDVAGPPASTKAIAVDGGTGAFYAYDEGSGLLRSTDCGASFVNVAPVLAPPATSCIASALAVAATSPPTVFLSARFCPDFDAQVFRVAVP